MIVTLPVKCSVCGEMIKERGRKKNSHYSIMYKGEKKHTHRGCGLSKIKTGIPRPDMRGDGNPMSRPEVRMKIINPMSRPECRAKHLISVRTPENRLRHAEIQKMKGDNHHMKQPNHRQRMRENATSRQPEVRQKLLYAWSKLTPGEKHTRLQNSLFKCREKPNVSESKLIPILDESGFTYIGWKEAVGGYYPDFINEDKYRIIEFDGYAGHNPKHPWTPNTWEECLAKDDKRDKSYRDAGYRVLSIFPEDVKEGDDFVRKKVGEWMLQ